MVATTLAPAVLSTSAGRGVVPFAFGTGAPAESSQLHSRRTAPAPVAFHANDERFVTRTVALTGRAVSTLVGTAAVSYVAA